MLDPELEAAVRQIGGAELNGFVTFYNKTFHYIYVRSKYLFFSLTECREFIKQVYLYAFVHIADLSSEDDPEKWLSKCVLACYHTLLLQNSIDPFEKIDGKDALPPVLPAGNGDTASCMDKDTCARILARQIRQLPVLPRILFLCFYHDGLSAEEISVLFGCPDNAVYWELEHAGDFLKQAYENAAPKDGSVLYPFGLALAYRALELENLKYVSTKEFARLVWDSIESELTFRKPPKKKAFTLPIFCCLSALILALLLVTMYSRGYFSGQKNNSGETNGSMESSDSMKSSDSMASSGENTEASVDPFDADEFKPTTTTTIREPDGTVTTYDENGSEIPAPE